ncbi:UNVERIFIED_CONTAM: hypothetical protein HDU68_007850 [Siphonaria sp. JEL0065]|nr:hypothetical protein HDU68_007850 [Siphonaria sp. JEL0065]
MTTYAASSATTAATSTTVLTSASIKRRASSLLLGTIGLFSSPPRESGDEYNQHRRGSDAYSHSKPSLRNDLLALLESGKDSDVLLVVGSDRVQFRAHRLILSTRSDFFRSEFAAATSTLHSTSLTQTIIELPFLDPDAFRIVLRYMYSSEEEDEATCLDTQDWRLVLACYQSAHHIGLQDRAQIYQRVFTHIFSTSNDPSTTQGRESTRDMWIAASSILEVEDLLVACAPSFWVLFGTESAGGNGNGLGIAGRQLLIDLKLSTLIRVLNAIPEYLESAVGRFRIVKSWMVAQPALGMFDDEEGEDEDGFMVGKHYDVDMSPVSPVSEYGEIVGSLSPPVTPTLMAGRMTMEAAVKTSTSPVTGVLAVTSVASVTAASTFASGTSKQALRTKESYNNLHATNSQPNLKTLIPRKPSSLQIQTSTPLSTPARTRGVTVALKVSQEQQTALQELHLPSLTATDILREIEPSNLLMQSHVLSLYRVAASTPSSSTSWGPVPSGFKGRRCSSWSSRTRWVHVGGSAAIGAGNVTYCTPEALGQMNGANGGRFTWTVVPLHGINGVGIGVSADVGATGGGSGGGNSSGSLASVGSTDDLLERLESGVSSLFGVPSGTASRRGSVSNVAEIGNSKEGNGMRFVGDDGGWSLWSDGTLRVGKIFVGRLPRGITFTRGSNVTVKLDLDARTLGFEVNGVDCGVAFRNLPVALYPSVVLGEAASVSVSPIKRVF